MRAASPGLTAYLAQARNGDAILLAVDCFTITLVTGQAINLTNYDQPVAFNGTTFVARSVLIDGLKYKTATGLEVDKQQLTFAAYPSQGISGRRSFSRWRAARSTARMFSAGACFSTARCRTERTACWSSRAGSRRSTASGRR